MVEKKSLTRKKIIVLVGVILLILIGIFRVQIAQIATFIFGVTIDKTINLVRKDQSFNILLMGKAGGTHDGPELTDTIILANVNVGKNKVNMFSIPRDLWMPNLKAKVNSSYQRGIKNNQELQVARKTIEDVTGQKIDYVLVLDFAGFTKLVDHLNGINVSVENSFSDMEYPITGEEDNTCGKSEEEVVALATESSQLKAFPCRYMTIRFSQGTQTMDGATALEFVRSRHGTNGEGSDFARSKRQQQVISAVKEKVFSLGVILNPVKVIGIFNILKDNIDTDVDIEKVDDFIKLANKMKGGQINSYVVDDGSDSDERFGLLKNPPITSEYGYQYVLIPRKGNGNFTEVHEYIQCIIDGIDCTVGESRLITPTPTPSSTKNATQK